MTQELIQRLDEAHLDETLYARRFAGCIVLSADGKIVLQQRDPRGCSFPDYLATFGGEVEEGETPLQGLVRELNEELGARVLPEDVISLAVFTEAVTDYTELVYGSFWHDRHGTITGCYEGQARYYENISAVLEHPKITDDLRWLLQECQKRGLLKI